MGSASPPKPEPVQAPLTLDAIRAENTKTGGTCTLAGFLHLLSPEDAATVRRAIADPSIQATAIARVLRQRGYEHDHQVIDRHRRRGCRVCGP